LLFKGRFGKLHSLIVQSLKIHGIDNVYNGLLRSVTLSS
jgi:hypothetical protein